MSMTKVSPRSATVGLRSNRNGEEVFKFTSPDFVDFDINPSGQDEFQQLLLGGWHLAEQSAQVINDHVISNNFKDVKVFLNFHMSNDKYRLGEYQIRYWSDREIGELEFSYYSIDMGNNVTVKFTDSVVHFVGVDTILVATVINYVIGI
jgi:hypothetical protein